MKVLKIFRNGLGTGLLLQLAIGPVFFYIVNLAIQRSCWDGFAGVLAVTLVDYFYITLSILGVGKLLENSKIKKVFGIVSSIVLVIFGAVIIWGIVGAGNSGSMEVQTTSLVTSFTSVFLLTVSSPMTIVFFTGVFASKAIELDYTKRELFIFGLGTGFATFIFMGSAVLLFSLIRGSVPILLVQILNVIVGCLLIGYGAVRLVKVLKKKNQ